METSTLSPRIKQERIEKYCDATPPAVAGNDGHKATYSLTCKLIQGFDLSPSEALPYLRRWNERCDPPWSEVDLIHKLNDAAKQPSSKGRGYLLRDSKQVRQIFPASSKGKPDSAFLSRGTSEQIAALAKARPYSREGLEWASERGLLSFGEWFGQEVFAITDTSGRAVELRRIDGRPFPAVPSFNLGERKSHALKRSEKSWPVGIIEAKEFPCIALVEGIPDFLECHYLILWEGLMDRVAPVAMLSGSPSIHPEALSYFKGKTVRIFPHVDATGLNGAEKWRKQLLAAGASHVDLFDFSPYRKADGNPVKDLYAFRDLHPSEYQRSPALWRILP